MTQVDDLSRSLTVFDQNTSLIVVVELSEASRLVAGLVPDVARQPLKKLAPDPDALLRLLERWKAEAVKTGQTIGRVILAYEAGRDGFCWRDGCRLAASRCTSSTRQASPCRVSTAGRRPVGWTRPC